MSFEDKSAELHELSDDDISEVVGGTRTDLYNNLKIKKAELVQLSSGGLSGAEAEKRQRNKKHKMTRIASKPLS